MSFPSLPGSRLRFFIAMTCKFSTITSTLLYSSSSSGRLCAQKPVFEIVREESVKAYLHNVMYNGNVQQNPLCVGSCH